MSFPRHPPPRAPSPPPPNATPQFDLEITVLSAKHLKNVAWRSGYLKPYVVFWIDPSHRLATKSDDSGSTSPIWNEKFLLPISTPLASASLFLEILHSNHSDNPKLLVGSLRVPLGSLPDPEDGGLIRKLQLRRPSGRPDGYLKLKLVLRERPLPSPVQMPKPSVPDYHSVPPSSYFYPSSCSAIPPPPMSPGSRAASYMPSSYGYPYGDPYMGYYSGYYSAPPPPPPRGYYGGGGSGPSAPVDYFGSYELKPRGREMGSGDGGVGVGAVDGGIGGLSLDEGLKKHVEEMKFKRVESDAVSRDDYSGYHAKYY